MSILPGQGFDGVGGEPRRLFPVSVQRVAGQVQAADFFFLLKQLCMAVLRECFDLIAVGIFASSGVQTAHNREQVQLAVQIALIVTFHALDNAVYGFHQTVAVDAHAVERTSFDEALHRPAVQLIAIHPLAEIVQAGIGFSLPFLHDLLNEVSADIFHGIQTKANLPVGIGRKTAARDIDIRRQHFNAQPGALARVLDDLIGIVQHTGEQSGHKLAGIMTLEIRGLECHIGIAGRMALVECVGRKAGHLIINFVGYFFGDAVCHAAGALVAGVGAAMDEMLPFGLHHGVLLFTHGAADIICLAERETSQLPENLHDLFLIDDAAVGHIQDMRQLGRFIADFIRFMAVAQVCRDGIHGAGAVQTDQSDDIFQVLRLQTHQDLFHARRFELEHTLRFTPGEHLVGLRVIIIQLCDRERWILFLNSNLRVPDDGQGAQTQEVHL